MTEFFARVGRSVIRAVLQSALRQLPGVRRPARRRRPARGSVPGSARGSVRGSGNTTSKAIPPYPGDWAGALNPTYAAVDDERADPGEIVWTWVPYEEDHSRGKDRPVLVVARRGPWLLALPLTSKDHDADAGQEASEGRHWVDIGSGAWDRSGRASEARIDRVLQIDPGAVRRVGARLSEDRFNEVAVALRRARRGENS